MTHSDFKILVMSIKCSGDIFYGMEPISCPREYPRLCLAEFSVQKQNDLICLMLVKTNGSAIEYITEPCEDICIAAVKNNPYAINHIKNPNEEICLAAVKTNGMSLSRIENPSEAVRLAAVTENGGAIQFIDNPSEALCIAAVKDWGFSLEHIKNPSKEVCLAAIDGEPRAIMFCPRAMTELLITKNKWIENYKCDRGYLQ